MVDFDKPVEWCGNSVRILCTDAPGSYPVIGITIPIGQILKGRLDGTLSSAATPLKNTPEKKSVFGLIYKDGSYGSSCLIKQLKTLEEARDFFNSSPYYERHVNILEVMYEDDKPVKSVIHPLKA